MYVWIRYCTMEHKIKDVYLKYTEYICNMRKAENNRKKPKGQTAITASTTTTDLTPSTSKTPFSDLLLVNEDKKLEVQMNDINVAVVNSLRRCIISNVPTVAFDYDPTCGEKSPATCGILVKTNTSPTHNEMLGHRLSIVPICVDESQLHEFMKDRYVYSFSLRVKNMTSSDVLLVTTRDITVRDKNGREVDTEVRDRLFPACRITGDHIILTKLSPSAYEDGEGGEVDIDCLASVGTEAQHSRWCPVSTCYFVNKIDPEAADEAYSALQQQGSGQPVKSRSQFDALDALRHYYTNEYGEANVFKFRLESECGLRAPFLIFQGFRVLIERVVHIRKALEARDTSKVAVASTAEIAAAKNDPSTKFVSTPQSKAVDNSEGVFNVVVSHEDHTVGNLVQALIYEKNFRKSNASDDNGAQEEITYIGYHQPHPLEHCIVFRVKMSDPTASSTNVEAFMVNNLSWIERLLQGYLDGWIDFANMRDAPNSYPLDKFLSSSQ